MKPSSPLADPVISHDNEPFMNSNYSWRDLLYLLYFSSRRGLQSGTEPGPPEVTTEMEQVDHAPVWTDCTYRLLPELNEWAV
jgi:hypothetical protein